MLWISWQNFLITYSFEVYAVNKLAGWGWLIIGIESKSDAYRGIC